MLHDQAAKHEKDNAGKIKSKIGLWMFLAYTIVYFGFILITVFAPELMGTDVGQMNLAIVYGLGLIVFAVILAFLYNAICAKYEKRLNGSDQDKKGGKQ